MCSRYFVWERKTGRRREVRPQDETPVWVMGNAGHPALQKMRWGFPSPENRGLVINARAESALEKPMFRDSVCCRRCLIAADGFYEWNREREKAVFTQKDGGRLLLAGIYRAQGDGLRFVILTTDANVSMRPVHDRMPLILGEANAAQWLRADGSYQALLSAASPELQREMEYEQQRFDFGNL